MLLTEDELRSSQAGQPLPLAPKWARWFHAFVDAGFLRSYLNGTTGEPWNVSAGARVAASAATTRSTSRAGRATSVSNGQIAAHTPNQTVTLGAFTLLGVGYIGAASGATTQVLAASADLNSPVYQGDIVFNRTSGTIQARVYKGATLTLDSGITFEYGRVYSCALPVIAGDARLYVDGSLRASDTGAGFVTNTTFRHLCLGNSEYTNANLNGGVLLGGVSKFFSPREAESLSRNPWQVFGAAHGIPIDSAAAAGTTINATASITDADDTISAAATADVAVSASFTDAADATNSAGAISIDAAVSVTDATDATSATSTVSIAAALSVTDGADSITSAGTVGFTGITADAAITDTADSITAAGTVSIAASASIADATDATNAAAAVALSSSFSVTDSTDSISAAGTVGGSLSGLTAAEIAAAVWAEPLSGATTASQILSGMADLLRDRGYLP